MRAPYAVQLHTTAGDEASPNCIPDNNPLDSTFATVRHRTIRSKGCLSNETALAMVFRLVEAGQKSQRRLDGQNQLPKVVQGANFKDGPEITNDVVAHPIAAA